jgi:hypothetical protein
MTSARLGLRRALSEVTVTVGAIHINTLSTGQECAEGTDAALAVLPVNAPYACVDISA